MAGKWRKLSSNVDLGHSRAYSVCSAIHYQWTITDLHIYVDPVL